MLVKWGILVLYLKVHWTLTLALLTYSAYSSQQPNLGLPQTVTGPAAEILFNNGHGFAVLAYILVILCLLRRKIYAQKYVYCILPHGVYCILWHCMNKPTDRFWRITVCDITICYLTVACWIKNNIWIYRFVNLDILTSSKVCHFFHCSPRWKTNRIEINEARFRIQSVFITHQLQKLEQRGKLRKKKHPLNV